MSRPRFVIALGAFLATAIWLASASGTARAAAPAVDLFQEGRRLLAAGHVDEACARFTESYAMVASSGTLLNLALCHQTQGKTATAWNEYKAAARLARNQGREDRATVADGKARTLEATLAHVTTTAVEKVPDLRVAIETGPLGEGGLGVNVPIDPGIYHVTVTAPGYLPWKVTLDVKEAQQVMLKIPRLKEEPLPPSLVTAPDPPGVVDSWDGLDRAPDARRSSVGLYLGVGGGLLLAGGTVFWSIAYTKFQSAKEACVPGCSKSDHDTRVSDIQTLKDIAAGSWTVGGALVLASGVDFIIRRKKAAVTVAIDPIKGGLSFRGSF
jgi:hypothetical protein